MVQGYYFVHGLKHWLSLTSGKGWAGDQKIFQPRGTRLDPTDERLPSSRFLVWCASFILALVEPYLCLAYQHL